MPVEAIDRRAPLALNSHLLHDRRVRMHSITAVDAFRVPLTGQHIELQQLDYEGGSMSQLRIRIRERSRFTIVDVDPVTATRLANALAAWLGSQSERPVA